MQSSSSAAKVGSKSSSQPSKVKSSSSSSTATTSKQQQSSAADVRATAPPAPLKVRGGRLLSVHDYCGSVSFAGSNALLLSWHASSHKHQIVVRRLPPLFTEADFQALMTAAAQESSINANWSILYYAPGKVSRKRGKVTGAGYLTVERDSDAADSAAVLASFAGAVGNAAIGYCEGHERGDPQGERQTRTL